jgi:hypothetical protein
MPLGLQILFRSRATAPQLPQKKAGVSGGMGTCFVTLVLKSIYSTSFISRKYNSGFQVY